MQLCFISRKPKVKSTKIIKRFPTITEDIKGACLIRKRRSHEEEKLHLE